jgi:hypothetical protein
MYLPSLWHNTKQSPGPNSNGPWNAVGGPKPKYELHHLRPGFARDLTLCWVWVGAHNFQTTLDMYLAPHSVHQDHSQVLKLKNPVVSSKRRWRQSIDFVHHLNLIPWPLQTCLETLWMEGTIPRSDQPPLYQPFIVFCFGMKYNKFSSSRHKDKSRIFFVFVFLKN